MSCLLFQGLWVSQNLLGFYLSNKQFGNFFLVDWLNNSVKTHKLDQCALLRLGEIHWGSRTRDGYEKGKEFFGYCTSISLTEKPKTKYRGQTPSIFLDRIYKQISWDAKEGKEYIRITKTKHTYLLVFWTTLNKKQWQDQEVNKLIQNPVTWLNKLDRWGREFITYIDICHKL